MPRRRVYSVTRELHLYLGLFISPFVLVFAASVFCLVHAWVPGAAKRGEERTVENVVFPAGLDQLKAREHADALQTIVQQLGVHGEIGFIRQIPRERRIVMPVIVPGREATVELNLAANSAKIATRATGTAEAVVYLHKMPGPHNVALRGNAAFMRAWRWLADATVYLLLFVSASGVYLWLLLKGERRIGIALLLAGGVTFAGLIFVLVG